MDCRSLPVPRLYLWVCGRVCTIPSLWATDRAVLAGQLCTESESLVMGLILRGPENVLYTSLAPMYNTLYSGEHYESKCRLEDVFWVTCTVSHYLPSLPATLRGLFAKVHSIVKVRYLWKCRTVFGATYGMSCHPYIQSAPILYDTHPPHLTLYNLQRPYEPREHP